jgi:hypothetical protein
MPGGRVHHVTHTYHHNEHHEDTHPSLAIAGSRSPYIADVVRDLTARDGAKKAADHQDETDQHAYYKKCENYPARNRDHSTLQQQLPSPKRGKKRQPFALKRRTVATLLHGGGQASNSNPSGCLLIDRCVSLDRRTLWRAGDVVEKTPGFHLIAL